MKTRKDISFLYIIVMSFLISLHYDKVFAGIDDKKSIEVYVNQKEFKINFPLLRSEDKQPVVTIKDSLATIIFPKLSKEYLTVEITKENFETITISLKTNAFPFYRLTEDSKSFNVSLNYTQEYMLDEYKKVVNDGRIDLYKDFIAKYPKFSKIQTVVARVDEFDLNNALKIGSEDAINNFVNTHNNSIYLEDKRLLNLKYYFSILKSDYFNVKSSTNIRNVLNFIPNTVQVYIGGYAASDYSKKLCLLFNNQIVDHEISKSVNVIDYLNLPNETFFTKNVKDYRDGYAVVNQQTKWTYYGQVTKTKQSVNIDNGTHFDGYYDLFIPNGFGIGILEEFYYEGYWENGLPNGVGVLMKKGSDFKSIQIGVFKNGEISEELESKKIIFYLNNPDLEIYTGKWSSKIPNTSQTQQVNAVGSFEGTFINENSKENFKGRMLVLTNGRLEKYYGQSNFTNGATFEGYWKSNSELLSGKLHFGNGIFYQGDFGDYSNYERAGMKIITTKNGQYHYDNGDIYIGEIKEGIIAGNGKLLKSDGTVKEGIWNNNQLIIDQNSSVYNSASKYSGAMKDVYLFDNGQYLSSLRNGMLNHSDPGGIQFSGKLNKDESTITVCYIGATANNVFYETDDCVYLESFQVMGNYIELGFKGSIRKRQNHYRIENTRDSNGKIKREFQRDEATYESMTFRLVINTTLQGNPYSFNFCFVDSNGRPDCGMGYYRGSLSYKE